ncbi:MAG: prenyltransferase/squalene oxidase repeat-containing protein [Gemmataceae bacterium]
MVLIRSIFKHPNPKRLEAAWQTARTALLQEQNAAGFWVGELSASALATAVAVMALHQVDPLQHADRISAGLAWLEQHQNRDGGWGDTTRSFSNISTAMLVRAAFALTATPGAAVVALEDYLQANCGGTAAARAEAIRRRYGKDRTFSVPILMTAAVAGLVPWAEVPRLPYELAALPRQWYRYARLPVVSYALPALIAIGQCIEHHRPSINPLRKITRERTRRILHEIQPTSGGYLEATPLTAFVVLSLATIGARTHPVVTAGVQFLTKSMRADGSWPIDTDLSVWLTTLSVNALTAGGIAPEPRTVDWILAQQSRTIHPFTGAAAGAWGWSDQPGSVPDCDDTPGALLAICTPPKTEATKAAFEAGADWICGLQNRDGGFPTFCRGWGALPFDRSGADLTAHALRALQQSGAHRQRAAAMTAGEAYLRKQQRVDGSWLPLWFGNQHQMEDENPVYGTARVLAAYRDISHIEDDVESRGIDFLQKQQRHDGSWGGGPHGPSSVEETAVATEVLVGLAPEAPEACRGVDWLIESVESGAFRTPAPIGFYFAKLWYFEKLYPLIFTVGALGAARSQTV